MNVSEEIKEQLLEKRQQNISIAQCSEWLNTQYSLKIPPTTLRELFIRWGALGKIEQPIPVNVTVQHDKEKEGLKAEVSYYKKLYQASLKDSAGMDKVVLVAKELTNAIPAVEVKYKIPSVKAMHTQTAVAPLCDTHVGEEVDIEQMAGLNEYNMEIFNKRLHGWAEQVVNLTQLRQSYVAIPILKVPLLGDMVSGDIHLELIKTNLDNVMGQMIRGAHLIAQSLVYLSQYFQKVEIPCVVGNHGRMTIKPPAKDKYVDWDYLLYQWIAAFCREQKNIKFAIPKSFMHVFEAEGKRILMMHGDSIHMWQQIPYYGIIRAIAQLRQVLQFRRGLEEDIKKIIEKNGTAEEFISMLANYFDSVILGHFHRHDEIDIGTGEAIICGCMKGGDEYSFGRLHTISRPKQIVTYWHPVHGYLGKDIVYLERYDKENRGYIDALPNIWADVKI